MSQAGLHEKDSYWSYLQNRLRAEHPGLTESSAPTLTIEALSHELSSACAKVKRLPDPDLFRKKQRPSASASLLDIAGYVETRLRESYREWGLLYNLEFWNQRPPGWYVADESVCKRLRRLVSQVADTFGTPAMEGTATRPFHPIPRFARRTAREVDGVEEAEGVIERDRPNTFRALQELKHKWNRLGQEFFAARTTGEFADAELETYLTAGLILVTSAMDDFLVYKPSLWENSASLEKALHHSIGRRWALDSLTVKSTLIGHDSRAYSPAGLEGALLYSAPQDFHRLTGCKLRLECCVRSLTVCAPCHLCETRLLSRSRRWSTSDASPCPCLQSGRKRDCYAFPDDLTDLYTVGNLARPDVAAIRLGSAMEARRIAQGLARLGGQRRPPGRRRGQLSPTNRAIVDILLHDPRLESSIPTIQEIRKRFSVAYTTARRIRSTLGYLTGIHPRNQTQ